MFNVTSAKASSVLRRPNAKWVFGILALVLFVSVLGSVAVGPVNIPLDQTMSIVLHQFGVPDFTELKSSYRLIVKNIRLPRVLMAALVGWILAASGVVMQGLFHNPLASPYLLGIASGASAGAALVIVLGLQSAMGGFALPLGAFAGGTAVVFTVYRLAQTRAGENASYTLILSGVALGALFSAITTLLIFLSGEQMREIVFWIMGNLGRSNWTYLTWLTPLALGGTAMMMLYMRDLNALALGETGARHLGLNPKQLHRILLLVTTLMASVAVAVTGTIGFVGLITPHALRLLVGPDHRLLLPASALGGAIFLVLSDSVARTAFAPLELPVGILTAFMGAPFFLFLLVTQRGGKRR